MLDKRIAISVKYLILRANRYMFIEGSNLSGLTRLTGHILSLNNKVSDI